MTATSTHTTLALSIVTPPTHAIATATAGRIEYSSGTFIGETSLTYQARDGACATAHCTLTLRSALGSPIVYETYNANALDDSDGVRSFRLHDALAAGARVLLLEGCHTRSAGALHDDGSLRHTSTLFYSDLRQPGIARRLSCEFTVLGVGVGEFAISDDGSKVAYQQSGPPNMWLIETAHSWNRDAARQWRERHRDGCGRHARRVRAQTLQTPLRSNLLQS